tara:strand:- start:1833 stop:2063 length:231 start_codon:yes stop_codon:yes gene_type:complete
MQKIINGIAIASGIVSLTVVGTVGYVFIRKDAIIESVKSKVMESVLPTVPSLPSLGSAGSAGAQSILPDLPTPMPF